MQHASPALPHLEPRSVDTHKGSFGHALMVGGSRGMTGAISLAGQAALRAGAGLVTIATPDSCLDTVAALYPGYMTAPLPCDERGRMTAKASDPLLKWIERATCIGIGPGLGQSGELVEMLWSLFANVPKPMVIDADALNNLAMHPSWVSPAPALRILTPHPGELQRLTGVSSKDRQGQAVAAKQLAKRIHGVVVLKGHRSLVTDGERVYENETGNPGMASGGSGDVLTGVIVALICQKLGPWEAASLGVYLHGLAGDLALKAIGGPAVLATDLITYLPKAFSKHQSH